MRNAGEAERVVNKPQQRGGDRREKKKRWAQINQTFSTATPSHRSTAILFCSILNTFLGENEERKRGAVKEKETCVDQRNTCAVQHTHTHTHRPRNSSVGERERERMHARATTP